MKTGVIIEHDDEYNEPNAISQIRVPDQGHVHTNSIEIINSSLYSIKDNLDKNEITSTSKPDTKHAFSPLTVVGNPQKYSITEKKSNYQQLATSTQRLISHSRRLYGEVYVRQRAFANADLTVSKTTAENLQDKVKRKTRLVKYEKIEQGNTVIHQQIDLKQRQFLIPKRVNIEENLEPIPPIIPVNNATINTVDQQSQKFHSTGSLSPIQEEPEEIEPSVHIPHTVMNKDLLAKYQSIETANQFIEVIDLDNEKKPLQSKHSKTSVMVPPEISQSSEEIIQHKKDENQTNITKPKTSKEQKVHKKKSLKNKPKSTIKQFGDVEPEVEVNEELLTPEPIHIEQTDVTTSEGKVIYHKVGSILKKKRKTSPETKTIEPKLTPRKAVPFISATPGKQTNVEDDPRAKHKKRRRKRRSRSKKKSKKHDKTDNLIIDSKSVTNQDAINKHLLNVQRFKVPPVSVLTFDQSRHNFNNIVTTKTERSRLYPLKPMIKKFEHDDHLKQCSKQVQNVNADDLDKDLFDFNQDTKPVDQPVMFTEYIRKRLNRKIIEFDEFFI